VCPRRPRQLGRTDGSLPRRHGAPV
jgi:hypothetical protein